MHPFTRSIGSRDRTKKFPFAFLSLAAKKPPDLPRIAFLQQKDLRFLTKRKCFRKMFFIKLPIINKLDDLIADN